MSAIIAIPARLESSRFPRKILAEIQGKPMLWHVYQGVSKAKSVVDVWVLSDSEEILQEARSWGAKTLFTSPDCSSGTDRIASVIDQLDADYIVNVQGDEPLITGDVVDKVVKALMETGADVATPVFPIETIADLKNPNRVKVTRSSNGTALYFSRSPIPYVRDIPEDQWLSRVAFWGHLGVYGYRRQVLLELSTLPEGLLEGAEKLEQLRLLEAGKCIATTEVANRFHGVDTPGDIEIVEQLMANRLASE